jgi:hypothetical protein
MPVLRKGDKGMCSCTFTNPATGATSPGMCDFEIMDAGQMVVKGA